MYVWCVHSLLNHFYSVYLHIVSYRGARKEALDEKLFTPLLTAVAWAKKEAVECLLSLGAEIDATDKDGSSSVFWATKLDCVEILKVIAMQKFSIGSNHFATLVKSFVI